VSARGDYWRHGLWRIDLALARSWSLGRAYGASLGERKALPGGNVNLTYGETPWGAIHRILTRLALGPGDTFLELGSGTGRFSLMAARLTGCKAVGVDLVAPFVDRANRIARDRGLAPRCRFEERDFFAMPWADATVVYCATTTFDDATLARFDSKCGELARDARVVTVTHPVRNPAFRQEWMEVLDYSWGPGTAFIQRANSSASR